MILTSIGHTTQRAILTNNLTARIHHRKIVYQQQSSQGKSYRQKMNVAFR
jgi:hypothetical protein